MAYINTCSSVNNKLSAELLAGRLWLRLHNTIDAWKQAKLSLSYAYVIGLRQIQLCAQYVNNLQFYILTFSACNSG